MASVFGAINNQITYSISPEFFTKSLFPQFGFVEYGQNTPRVTAAIIGVWSTWWIGLIIGIVQGFTGLIHKNSNMMLRKILQSIFITISVVMLFAVFGYAFGKVYLLNTNINWGFSGTQEQLKNFIIAGYIHDFEYFGGILGLISGVYYQFRSRSAVA